jgi:ribonucleoside-diphosphate reductase alpha chain
MSNIQVIKRNGSKEILNLDKLHKVVFHACEGIAGVSPSEVELKSAIQFYNGITTDEIQETLIKAAADLISEETPNYQSVAGRLIDSKGLVSQRPFRAPHHTISDVVVLK